MRTGPLRLVGIVVFTTMIGIGLQVRSSPAPVTPSSWVPGPTIAPAAEPAIVVAPLPVDRPVSGGPRPGIASEPVDPGSGSSGFGRASRVVMDDADIDLPVVLAPVKTRYPPCDVAEAMREFRQPGQGGTTYIYAHARRGMFGGLLDASRRSDDSLIGSTVHVYTDDGFDHRYAVTEVHRRQPYTGFRVALDLDGEALVLQTSETSRSTGTKLIVVARLVGVRPVTLRTATPTPHPRACA